MSSIGPALPPHLQNRNKDDGVKSTTESQQAAGPNATAVNEEDEEDSFGPALPPHLLAKRKNAVAGPSAPSANSPPPASTVAKNVGPTLPPHLAARREYESDSDDDDVGPSIHMASRGESAGDGVREFLEREARIAKEREVCTCAFFCMLE